MPTKVYACGSPKEARAARTWLARSGFEALPPPAETPLWADDAKRTVAAADLVVALAGGKGASPVAEFELGLAAGMGKRVLAVGAPERLGYGHGEFIRCGSWEEAKARLQKFGTDAPEVRLSPNDANYVLKFWNEFAVKVVGMPGFIDRYAPGVAARVADHARARGGIYQAVYEAWERTGRPGAVGAAEDGTPLSPEARAFADNAAVTEWFGRVVKAAEIDHTRETLAHQKEAVLAGPAPGNGQPSVT